MNCGAKFSKKAFWNLDERIVWEFCALIDAEVIDLILWSNNKDISDTETVDDFFNHVSEIMENKGVKVDKDSNKYTLFDDIIEDE